MTYRKQEMLFGIVGFVTGALLMVHSFDPMYAQMAQDISIGPMFFPRILFCLWKLCSAGIIWQAMQKDDTFRPFLWLRILAAFVTLIFFAACINYLGFFIVGFISFFAMSWIIGYRQLGKLMAMAFGYTLFVNLVFRYALQCYLPTNPIIAGMFGG